MPKLEIEGTSVPQSTTVGFVGLGVMGSLMVDNLIDSNTNLLLFDKREAVLAAYAPRARIADNLSQVIAEADTICLCIVGDDAVTSVASDVIEHGRPGQILVIHSCILPTTMQRIDERARSAGIAVVDAPVSGARPAAARGELTIMAAGDAEAVDRCRALLAVNASNVFYLGPAGKGQEMKIINNIMLHTNHLVALEACRLASAFGLDEDEVMAVAGLSTGNSWVVETWPLMDEYLTRHTQAGEDSLHDMFTHEQWHAVLTARQLRVSVPLTAVAVEVSRDVLVERQQLLEARATAGEGTIGPRWT